MEERRAEDLMRMSSCRSSSLGRPEAVVSVLRRCLKASRRLRMLAAPLAEGGSAVRAELEGPALSDSLPLPLPPPLAGTDGRRPTLAAFKESHQILPSSSLLQAPPI